MTASPSMLPGQWNPPLLRAEGTALLSAHQAIVKGALESELAVDAIVAPRQVPFEPVFALLSDPSAARALEQHQMTVTDSVDAARAVSLAVRAAGEGKRVLALVPNEQLAMATSVARFAVLDRLLLKRGSSVRSGRPIAGQKIFQSFSLPTASARSWVRVRKV